MKKSYLLLAFSLCLFLPGLSAQKHADITLDLIVENYIEAIGGEEAWKAVKSMKSEASMSMQGMNLPVNITQSYPNLFRLDINVQGQKIIQSYDGETAWQIMPMMGITTPTAMSSEEAKTVSQTEILNEFIDYEKRGYTLEMVGTKEIEGVQAQGVRLTDGADKDMTYYFDLEYFVPIMISAKAPAGPMGGATFETYLSDYQEVDGLMMPFYTDVKVNGNTMQAITINKVELNPAIEADYFSMPKK